MIDRDAIMAMMREGKSAEDIAKAFTNTLNEAERAYKAEQTNSKRKSQYEMACADAAVAMNDALDAYAHWKGIKEFNTSYNTESIKAIIETVGEMRNLVNSFKSTCDTDFDSVVERFFKKYDI